MSSEQCVSPTSNNPVIIKVIIPSGSSLMDMLNQQSNQPTNQDNSISNSELNSKDNDIVTENDKLSTLFNTTGRERNSTGPLKQWLYEHQDNPYPNEMDRQELMKKTKMSASQITIWFTNARVKMRKENKLPSNVSGKKKKKNEQDHSPQSEEILIVLSDDDVSETNISSPIQLNNKPIVMAYSSLNVEELIELQQFASMYPNQLSISGCVNDDTTHLIIGQEAKPLLCPLTLKLFQSMSRHLYVISYRWITECLKQNDIIDEINYEIRGDVPFGEYHDGMRKSRLSKQVKLFSNCQFFILCNGCQDKMSKTELISLIELCHGSILDGFPLTATMDNSVLTIVLCKDLLPFESSNQQQLFELSRSNGVYFINPEWIFESIVQFALQPFEYYEENF